MIVEALKIALERNARSWGYVKGILRDWHSKNVRTLQDVQALEAEFVKKKNAQRSYSGSSKKEMVPDWLSNGNQQVVHQSSILDLDFESEKAQLEAELAQYRKVTVQG